MKLLSASLALVGLVAPVSAISFSYEISGIVTSAPNVPNAFPEGPQWDLAVGNTFFGSFIADSTTPGPVSDFALEVGGIDVPAFHPENTFPLADGSAGELNFFDPSTLSFRWAGIDTDRITTFVSIGESVQGIQPDRIVAIQFTDPQIIPPGDPTFLTTINWEGTFSVTQGSQVPEASSNIVLASMGLGGLLLVNALIGRKKRS